MQRARRCAVQSLAALNTNVPGTAVKGIPPESVALATLLHLKGMTPESFEQLDAEGQRDLLLECQDDEEEKTLLWSTLSQQAKDMLEMSGKVNLVSISSTIRITFETNSTLEPSNLPTPIIFLNLM